MTVFPRHTIRARRLVLGLTIPEAAALTEGRVSANSWGNAERGDQEPSWSRGCVMLTVVGLTVALTVEAK